jgi:hypothetical protein
MNPLDEHVGGDKDLARHSHQRRVISWAHHNGIGQTRRVNNSLDQPKLPQPSEGSGAGLVHVNSPS